MPYIGPPAPDRFVAPKAAKQFSGDGSTTAFTLDHAVGSDEDILVSVDGVIQEPSVAYAVSNGTTLTFTAAPSSNSGNNIFVYYLFRTVGTVSHPSNNALTATNGTLTGTLDVTGATTLSDDVTIADKIIHDGDTNTAIRFPAADTISFESGGSERARFHTDGSFNVGSTSNDSATLGARLKSYGRGDFTTNGGVASIMTRLTSGGDILSFKKDSDNIGQIGTNGGLYLGSGDTGVYFYDTDNSVIPCDPSNGGTNRDDAIDLGYPSVRFDDVRATNGTIQTSDRNDKQDIEELSDAEKRVAVVAKGLMRKFRWKSKVAIKGDKARTHFGIIAQDLEDAFKAEGLDASKYAMFCSDTWWEKEISVDAVEADEEKGIEAKDAYTYMDTKEEATEGYTEKTRLGVRYSELLAFIISAI